MARSKKSTALSKATMLENALKQDNVIDLRSFFQYRNNSSDYWISAMILTIDNITKEQKIRLACKVIKDKDAFGFFFKNLYGIEDY